MKRVSIMIEAMVALFLMGVVSFAEEFPNPVRFGNRVEFDTGARVNYKSGSTVSMDGTQVTPSAAEMNQLDGNIFTSDITYSTGETMAGLPRNTFTFMEDFYSIITSTNVTESMALLVPWKHTGDTAVTADSLVGATAGGVLSLISGSTDNNEVYLQYGAQGTEGAFNITSNGTKELWFETRVCAAPSGNEGGFFVGLADPGASAANFLIDNAGTVDTNVNHIGFWCGTLYSNAYYNFVVGKADAAAGSLMDAAIVTNTAATYVKLGFHFDGVRTTTVYVNGTARSRVHTNNAVSYPDAVVMAPIIASKTGGSYSNTNKIDYIWVQQER